MNYEILKARGFKTDVDEIFVYIGSDNVEAAIRFVEAVDTTLDLISTQPFAGFERDFQNDRLGQVRFWPVKGFDRYLIAYQPDRETQKVRAIRLLNSYRDFSAIFAEERNGPLRRAVLTSSNRTKRKINGSMWPMSSGY